MQTPLVSWQRLLSRANGKGMLFNVTRLASPVSNCTALQFEPVCPGAEGGHYLRLLGPSVSP